MSVFVALSALFRRVGLLASIVHFTPSMISKCLRHVTIAFLVVGCSGQNQVENHEQDSQSLENVTQIKAVGLEATTMELRWTPPSQSVSQYRIVYSRGNQAPASCDIRSDGYLIAEATERSIRIRGLEPEQWYSFRICAVYRNGTSVGLTQTAQMPPEFVQPCGNGVLDDGELCDISIAAGRAGSCPKRCDDVDEGVCAPTGRIQQPGSCQAQCVYDVAVRCKHDDGCCPEGCESLFDNDCSVAPKLASFVARGSHPILRDPITSVRYAERPGIKWHWSFANQPAPKPGSCTILKGDKRLQGDRKIGDIDVFTFYDTTTFTLICSNGRGSDSKTVTIEVVDPELEISTFRTFPKWVKKGVPTKVHWTWGYETSVMPETSCTIDNGVGPVSPGTTTMITMSEETTFTLTCSNRSGTKTKKTTIVARDSDEIVDVAPGGGHTCVLFASGAVKCWGFNGNGELGNPAIERASFSPVNVVGLPPAIGLAAGANHTCALLADRTLQCWGKNEKGQIGDGSMDDRFVPTVVEAIADVIDVFAGWNHSCAMRADNTVSCWGWNQWGQLGDGATEDQYSPSRVVKLNPVIDMSLMASHSCAITAERASAYCWGLNVPGGILGINTRFLIQRETPLSVGGHSWGLGPVEKIAAGLQNSCALLPDKTIRCWGQNANGQLGDGTTRPSWEATSVTGIADAQDIVGGADHVCALVSGGSVRCWGENDHKQLGDEDKQESSTPVSVQGVSQVRRIFAGVNHTCVLLGPTTLKCWGHNGSGQLGNGSNIDSATPVEVLDL